MVPWLSRGLSYCCQAAFRVASKTVQHVNGKQVVGKGLTTRNPPISLMVSSVGIRSMSVGPPSKFSVPSPYKKPAPARHGYQQKFYDGGRLPRGLADPLKTVKPYRPKDSWARKRALFGQNDYIDILGDTHLHPVDLINAPRWIKGFNGNELQRLVRRLNFEGPKIKQLYPKHHHEMWKRVKFLYKKYNQKRGRRNT